MRFRFFFLISGVTLSFLFVIYNLYNLQIKEGQYWGEQAQASSKLNAERPRRGTIFLTDRDGSLIQAAIDKDRPIVFAVPKEVKDPVLVSSQVSTILGLDAGKTTELLSHSDSEYALLSRTPTEDQVSQINKAQIQGVYIDTEKTRFYPFRELASQVLGYVGLNADSDAPTGRYGIESQYETQLAGSEKFPGKDIELTIDRNIQARAEEILKRTVSQYHAKEGSVIVMDPKTGKILAMGGYPSFDPNEYGEFPVGSFQNHSVSSVYEPGSVFKVLTMSAGIDSGAITPQTTYYDSGEITLNGYTIRNWDLKSHGTLTMTQVIENSVNTGSIFAQRQTGQETFYNYLVKFGFKELTNIELPNEALGKLTPLEKYVREVAYATASYGQGISTTPLRLIAAIGAIANHGIMRRPYIVASEYSPETVEVMKPATAEKVTKMMVSSVKKNVVADIPNYDVAGKTGTAFIPDFVHGGYTDQVINTYVGFAPANDPKFIILVKLEKPDGAPLAGQTVVPAFRELAEFILNYYNIPPTQY